MFDAMCELRIDTRITKKNSGDGWPNECKSKVSYRFIEIQSQGESRIDFSECRVSMLVVINFI